jgi:hypothetical protein
VARLAMSFYFFLWTFIVHGGRHVTIGRAIMYYSCRVIIYTFCFYNPWGEARSAVSSYTLFFSLSWGEARSIGRVNRYTFPSELGPPRLTFVRLDEHLKGTIGRVIIYTFIFSLSLGEARSAVPIETYFFFNTLGGDTIGRVIIYTFFIFFLNGGRHDRPCHHLHFFLIFSQWGEARSAVSVIT